MSVLDDGVAVLAGLSRDLLALADAHILDEPAFEVLLEELPDLLSYRGGLRWDHRGDPN